MEIKINVADVVLCEFYFSDLKRSKKRPVLVFRDNLPYDDFVGIPISSRLGERHRDESLIDSSKFSEGGIPKTSKIMVRKTFVVSKSNVIKKYGTLKEDAFRQYHRLFCFYFNCIGKA